jgi:hypothetical protein
MDLRQRDKESSISIHGKNVSDTSENDLKSKTTLLSIDAEVKN